jgi:hypothetical protein
MFVLGTNMDFKSKRKEERAKRKEREESWVREWAGNNREERAVNRGQLVVGNLEGARESNREL